MARSNVVPLARRPQLSRATAVSLPAPIGGWNARDSLGDMPKDDAVSLINMMPATTSVNLRFGHTQHKTGFGAQVQTVIAYSGSTTNQLFGIAGNSVYNATTAGAIGAAVLSGLTNNKWQYVNLTTAGGNFIEMCNGADSVYTYNGTTWTDQSGNITGVTSSTLININLHKNRLWFCQVGTLKAWYLPVQSISGAAAALDLSAFCPHGGYLMAMATWTIDAGYGVDDLAVFVTSNGDVLVYRGTDPSSASTWALVGVWWLGSPVGRRCFVKWKGDMLLICQDGVVALSSALQSSRLNPRVALTDKIQYAMSTAVTNYGTNFGWQLLPYPKQNLLLLNVPVVEGQLQEQYVMNTITGAWGRFQGWYANCWELFGDDIYFGSNGFVGKAWNTNSDNGNAITFTALQAFNYFGAPGQAKRFSRFRPTFQVSGLPTISGNMAVDFDQTAPASSLAIVSGTAGVWDTATWDNAVWGVYNFSRAWQGATGVGFCGAPNLSGSALGMELQWISTDVSIEPGGFI